jgi:DNA-binding MarR family transcriptional regulator
LTEVEQRPSLSQRSLSARLGIALGLTNLLVRRLVKKGWVRVVRIRPNQVRYLLTLEGIAEKARMSRLCFSHSVRFYSEARDRVRDALTELSATWDAGEVHKRVCFYGADEVAEIAYICLQETDLTLMGVVDDGARGRFFGLAVQPSSALRDRFLANEPYGRLIVVSVEGTDAVRRRLEERQVPLNYVHWL